MFLFRQVQGEMIDPQHMLEAMGKIVEITVVVLHRSFHLCQQVDCVFSNFHTFPPICHESSVGRDWLERYSLCPASEDGFLLTWLGFDDCLVAVDVRAAADFRALVFLVVIDAGERTIAVSLSCIVFTWVASVITTEPSGSVDSSPGREVASTSVAACGLWARSSSSRASRVCRVVLRSSRRACAFDCFFCAFFCAFLASSIASISVASRLACFFRRFNASVADSGEGSVSLAVVAMLRSLNIA